MLCGAMAKAAGRRGLAGRFGVSPRSNTGWAARSMNVAWIRSPGLGVIREARSPIEGGLRLPASRILLALALGRAPHAARIEQP